jgi:hypothetical protein
MMKVTIVGVGALGSHLVQFLRNEEVTLHVIDFDRVEQRNVASQFHSKTSVGKKKVDALKQSMAFLYGRRVSTIGHMVTKGNVGALLSEADLIIDCLDNGEARRLVQDWVCATGIPCLHGALSPDGSFGRVIWDKNFVIDDEAGIGTATCENGEFLPFIAIVSAYLARAAQIFLQEERMVGYSISPNGAVSV